MIRKCLITFVGGLLLLLGILFVVLPGPAVIILPLALAILSLEYPIAKQWLRKTQYFFKAQAQRIDRYIQRK